MQVAQPAVVLQGKQLLPLTYCPELQLTAHVPSDFVWPKPASEQVQYKLGKVVLLVYCPPLKDFISASVKARIVLPVGLFKLEFGQVLVKV